jgi:hypothetical protein
VLVVIDANLLFAKLRNAAVLKSYGRAARWANAALDRLGRRSAARSIATGEGARYAPAELPAQHGIVAPEFADRWLERAASSRDANYEYAAELLSELHERAVPACIVTVPVSDLLREHSAEFLGDARALAAELAAQAGVPLFVHEPYAPDRGYVDTVHMNDAGRPKYSAWFVKQVAPLIE